MDKKAEDVVILELAKLLIITDYFVICSGRSTRQVLTIAGAVEDALRDLGVKPLGQEGRKNARWVLLDYGDIVVHVFLDEEREYYQLERLWKDAPRLELEAAPSADASSP